MNNYYHNHSNYDKQPSVLISSTNHACTAGWQAIGQKLKQLISERKQKKTIVIIECYLGVNEQEILKGLQKSITFSQVYHSYDAFKTPTDIDAMVFPDVTDDEVFGYMTRLTCTDFFDPQKREAMQNTINRSNKGVLLLIGTGASLIHSGDISIYADMPRREGQLRFRRNESSNLGVSNYQLKASLQYKRAYFVDWRVCDKLKKNVLPHCDFILDTTSTQNPLLLEIADFFHALDTVVSQPFRLVPFFDPGPWGGQWMKEVCNLDRNEINYAWCFDCVPEENSLLLQFGQYRFETCANNIVFFRPETLLGPAVYGRFGDEFPIRFDFLDTMGGGNLSLQVHPLTAYIQEHFGMCYTQDESYYILDAGEDATVYLGLRENIHPKAMLNELMEAQQTGEFATEKHVNCWSVKAHDHILIPAGTVHCSGKNTMVLEISATPYIFTFKLWDWGRTGLDGKPRPINIGHGGEVINWNLTPARVSRELINTITPLAEGDGWHEERTGLHEAEFIETRRHWFTKTVLHQTNGVFHVLNLISGREALVESPTQAFKPFIVHYAETFIIPAQIETYTIRPYGESEGKECATIKAFVRKNA